MDALDRLEFVYRIFNIIYMVIRAVAHIIQVKIQAKDSAQKERQHRPVRN